MNRRGSTLTEILAATVVFGVVATAGLSFMTAQHGAFSDGAHRLESIRLLRQALDTFEADARNAGIHLAHDQPALVYAGDDVLAFFADHTSDRPGDGRAVHVDPAPPRAGVAAPSAPVPIGGTGWSWAPSSVAGPGGTGTAELIVFWFAPDPSTPRDDDYVLFRSVDGLVPERLAGGLLRDGDRPFFEYDRVGDAGGPTRLVPVDPALLPLRHEAPLHGSPADTGRVARVDAIRTVRVAVGFPDTGTPPAESAPGASLGRRVEFPNVGLDHRAACGAAPGAVPLFTARTEARPDGEIAVRLTWAPSPDDTDRTGDVVRYVVWRSVDGADWGNPLLSVPAGRDAYSYLDTAVEPGRRVRYALAAQDCTPAVSRRTASAVLALR